MEVYKGFGQRYRGKLNSAFYGMHPSVVFLYFVGLFVNVFLWNNPVFSIAVMAFILLLDTMYVGLEKTKSAVKGGFLLSFVIIIINPLLSHRGVHILFYLLDNPITLEAFLYGVLTAIMIFSMYMAFLVFNTLMDSERFLFLFGKFFPKIGFITSMSLRYTSLFKNRAKDIIDVAKTRGEDIGQGKFRQKMKTAGKLLKALLSWCLEEGMMISEVLKAKEYGKFRRTAYRKYKLILKDISFIVLIGFCQAFFVVMHIFGAGAVSVYPRLLSFAFGKVDILAFIIMILYLSIPFLLEFFEAIQRRKNNYV